MTTTSTIHSYDFGTEANLYQGIPSSDIARALGIPDSNFRKDSITGYDGTTLFASPLDTEEEIIAFFMFNTDSVLDIPEVDMDQEWWADFQFSRLVEDGFA